VQSHASVFRPFRARYIPFGCLPEAPLPSLQAITLRAFSPETTVHGKPPSFLKRALEP
jgi:hypothetical protein